MPGFTGACGCRNEADSQIGMIAAQKSKFEKSPGLLFIKYARGTIPEEMRTGGINYR